jgi:hypothetical protein
MHGNAIDALVGVCVTVVVTVEEDEVTDAEKTFSSGSLLARLMMPLRAPVAVGTKETVNVVVALGASVATAGCVTVKSPVLVMARPVRLAVPVFLTVKVCALLLLPTWVLVNDCVPVLSVRSSPAAVLAPVNTESSGASAGVVVM